LTYTISHRSTPYTLSLPSTATLSDLKSALASLTSIPPQNQKLLYKPPHLANDSDLAAMLLDRGKIMMIGTPASTVAAVQSPPTRPRPRTQKAAVRPLRQAPPTQADIQYTFRTLQPLPYLPNSTHAHSILSKLASDPAVRAIMLRHKFSVGVLGELDPATHTNHEGRTLGLNTNRGAMIEVRLRTDEDRVSGSVGGRGWRRYRDVRDVLAHELAHNVYREHDAKFWRLCRQLEGEM
ncbi:WLM-domain-containing protein, partial [Saitoella complicata NRRL Y-17804]